MRNYDAIIIGSGPNGFAAAITLAQSGLYVAMFEAKETIGGGMRSAELTLPGFTHDICSAIHPLGVSSPFFRSLPLTDYGLEWLFPQIALAHPFEDATAALLKTSIDETGQTLGIDRQSYKNLMKPLKDEWNLILDDLLGPLSFPHHPIAMGKFGLKALRSAQGLINSYFKEKYARALFTGLAAHAALPLDQYITAAFGLILGTLGHTIGWPTPKGGSQNLANALAAYFQYLGGEIVTNHPITNLNDLPPSKIILCDITPRQFLEIAKDKITGGYKQDLEKFRYGQGIFKVDWALSDPIPWKASECRKAGTLHLGGEAENIIQSEKEIWQGKHPQSPFVLLAQQTVFDPSRAPPGKHTAWGYCHVPKGSNVDMTEIIENQIEKYAPHFKDCILGRHAMSAVKMEQYNSNYIGGDINGGAQDLSQLFKRPTSYFKPYSTCIKGVYICSSSTPPGGGVHGMCGYHAAKTALSEMS